MPDPFDLQRFVFAQDENGTYYHALQEVRAGRKTGHWIWFVFPQIAGLGRSVTAHYYAIKSLDEARAYLEHPILGPRLNECCRALLALPGNDAEAIFGSLDAMKLRSSMTLFAHAGGDGAFTHVLENYFGGAGDPATVGRLE